MKQMKVKDLYKACKEQMDKGNGDKYIVVADDNEGNGYHGMFYEFSEKVDDILSDRFMLHDTAVGDINKLIILG